MTSRVNSYPSSSGGIFTALGNLPLSVKLVIAFIVVTTLAEITLVYFNTTTSSQELIRNLGENLNSRGQAQVNLIISLVDQETIGHLTTLSLNKIIQDEVDKASSSYTGSDAEIEAQLQRLDQQWVNGGNSDPLIQSKINGEAAAELDEFRSNFPSNVEIFATDRYGAVVVATNRTSDYYQADEEWWQKAWNDGQGGVFIGQPEYDQSSQTNSITIAIPIDAHDPTGNKRLIGVFRTTLDITPLFNLLTSFKLGDTGHIDLILPNGQTISHDSPIAQPIDPTTQAALASLGNESYTQIAFAGQEALVSQISFADISDKSYIDQLGWKLLVHQDISEALQPVTDAQRSAVIAGTIVLLVVVVVAVLFARLITRPIVRLTRATEQFASGDFSQRAEIGSRDEIGSLSFGFNTMAEQLQDLVGTLEQRIADSTRDLQTVADVNAQISTVLDENRLLQDVVDLTKERFRLYHSHIYLLDETGRTLTLVSGAGHVGRQMVSEVRTIALTNQQSIVANAARSRSDVIINDVSESKTFLPHPLLPDTAAELAVPLVARGQLLGVLDVQSENVGYFTQDTLSVIELMASQIAVAISNARLYENAERTSRHERALGTIDRKIQEAVDMDEILQVTVRELGKALRVPYTAIELRLNQSDEQNDNQGVLS